MCNSRQTLPITVGGCQKHDSNILARKEKAATTFACCVVSTD